MAKLLINALEKSGVDCKAEKYTATSARKTMMDGGLDAGIPEVLLSWKGKRARELTKLRIPTYKTRMSPTERRISLSAG